MNEAQFDLGLGDGFSPEVSAAPKKERRAVIFIDQEEGKPNYEFVGVNGVGYQIKRGEEVTVPMSVIGVLNNAIATRSTTDADGRISGTQDYLAVPFRIIRYLD